MGSGHWNQPRAKRPGHLQDHGDGLTPHLPSLGRKPQPPGLVGGGG